MNRTGRALPRTALISAAASAVLVAGGFAMIAVLPVILTALSVLLDVRLRPLRPWTALLVIAYGSGLALHLAGPDPAPSLTKDLHPLHAVVIVLAALAVVVRALLMRRAARRTAPADAPADTDAGRDTGTDA
ncbi:hypothetical protein [Brachybacterium kimchii]|uniref:Integral membrane protein n=1 Tax=Brachybacterium kimchii TaxID=2942909 RepID=A0ABY4N2Z3_9MICO|nr:hypothetical protein [Brachybacterium kimchii]UQN28211.1 hypothetical protein M4486_11170 [Brachybacterium kimchii]